MDSLTPQASARGPGASNGKLPSLWRGSDGASDARAAVQPDNSPAALQGGLDQLHRDVLDLTSALRAGLGPRGDAVGETRVTAAALTGCAVGVSLGCALTLAVLSTQLRR